MRFRDSEPQKFERHRLGAAFTGLLAVGTLSLVGCEKPLTAEQRANCELQVTVDNSAQTIIELMTRPESSSSADGDAYYNPAAADPAAPNTYPALYAQGVTESGKNWIRLGIEATEQPDNPKWTTVGLLYEAEHPLRGSQYDPLTIDDIHSALDQATLTAATVRIASGHPYSVVFQDGEGSVSITRDLLPGAMRNEDVGTKATYELLKTAEIVLADATKKAVAVANASS